LVRGKLSGYPVYWERPLFGQPFLVSTFPRNRNEEKDPFAKGWESATNFQECAQAMVNDYPIGSWALFVPYWFPILLFLVQWVGFLAWRARKLRRLTKADA
jgi:hypothetical protein